MTWYIFTIIIVFYALDHMYSKAVLGKCCGRGSFFFSSCWYRLSWADDGLSAPLWLVVGPPPLSQSVLWLAVGSHCPRRIFSALRDMFWRFFWSINPFHAQCSTMSFGFRDKDRPSLRDRFRGKSGDQILEELRKKLDKDKEMFFERVPNPPSFRRVSRVLLVTVLLLN